jgi:hypothetical protein
MTIQEYFTPANWKMKKKQVSFLNILLAKIEPRGY